ncbi:MAG: hypothetical protein N2645_08205 [Clostridia bacterium]|nr:hypothetical protein [Clostridia bacterium]
MQHPDIVGLTLGDAKEILEMAGIHIDNVVITSPPREKIVEYKDSFRVIKVNKFWDNKVELLVCKPL